VTEPSLRADTRLATPDPAFLAAVRPLPEELEGLAPRLLAAVIHDVAPSSWSDCRSLIDQLDEMGIRPLSLLGGMLAVQDGIGVNLDLALRPR